MTAVLQTHQLYLGEQRVPALVKEDQTWPPPPPWQPLDLGAALFGWWDAADPDTIVDAGAGAVSQWRDKSGNDRHLIQNTAVNRPVTGTRTLNDLNTLAFDPSGGKIPNLAIAAQTLTQPFTFVAVAVWDDADTLSRNMVTGASVYLRTASGVWNMSAGLSLNAGTDDGLPHIFIATYNAASSSLRKDGVATLGNASTLGIANTTLLVSRATNTTCWDGQIAEIIIVTAVLDEADLTGIETYLREKWGLT